MSRIMPRLRLPAAITAAVACALLLSAAGAVAKPIAAYTTKGAWSSCRRRTSTRRSWP